MLFLPALQLSWSLLSFLVSRSIILSYYIVSFHSCMSWCPLALPVCLILCIFLSSMYIFGGFSGLLLNDVLAYTPPSCQAFSDPALCAAAGPGVRCHWVKSRCVPWEPKPAAHIFPAPLCPSRPGTLHRDPVCWPIPFHLSRCSFCFFLNIFIVTSTYFPSRIEHNLTQVLLPKGFIFHEDSNY